jgi:para-nitrobenzyl esterase
VFRLTLFAAALTLAACSSQAQDRPTPGLISDGIAQWRGIEYATAERWKLPELNPDWTDSDMQNFGPACPQDGQAVMVEDCLFLNVFAPEENISDLPVMVWIHGGGLRAGQGGDGPKNFTHDDVLVVTFNYRLAKLGFMDWPGWDEDDPRNFGQADMVAALKWVQENIAKFGGDPDNVTLAGHSAGGMGVQLMMVDPRAEGLFDRAWSHAGYGAWPFPKATNPSDEERAVIKYGPLRTEATAAELVAQTPYFQLPYIDTPFLREQPIRLFWDGFSHDVPYVAGVNSMDGAGTLQGAGYTPDAFLAMVDSPELRKVYAADFAVSDRQAAERIFGDLRYLRSSVLTVNAKRGQLFYYDGRDPGAPGAYHGAQYGQLFGTGEFAMKRAMISFIKTGETGWDDFITLPNGRQAGAIAVFSPELSLVNGNVLFPKLKVLAEAVKTIK